MPRALAEFLGGQDYPFVVSMFDRESPVLEDEDHTEVIRCSFSSDLADAPGFRDFKTIIGEDTA